jgi:peptidoglycan/LPS O-acetylase OafA/YrhL
MRLTRHARFDFASSPYTAFSASRYIDGLGPYWSLEVEELFYLLWAPVILKCPRRIIMAFAIAPLFICPVLRGLVHTANAYEYGGFLPRFDTLAVGGCLALLLRAKPDLPKWVLPCSVSLALAGLLGLCTHCGLFRGVEVRSTELFSVVGYSLLALLFGCVVGSCVQWEKHAVLAPLRLRPVVYIGTISYTMYLTHVLIFAAALRIFGQGSLPGTVAIALTVGVAALSWKYFETPILRLRNWPERARRGAEKHFTAVAD